MSITFQVEIKDVPEIEKKEYLADVYGLDEEYFKHDPFALFDETLQKHYQVVKEPVCDFMYEKNFTSDFFNYLLSLIDHNIKVKSIDDGGYGYIEHNDIQSFRKKVFFALNKINEKHIVSGETSCNMIFFGYSMDRITNGLNAMLAIMDGAYKNKFNVFWS